MSAADLFDADFPHGTPAGYDKGCRGAVCPNHLEEGRLTCKQAKIRYQWDQAFRAAIDAGEEWIEPAPAPAREKPVKKTRTKRAATKPKPKPVPKPAPPVTPTQASVTPALAPIADDAVDAAAEPESPDTPPAAAAIRSAQLDITGLLSDLDRARRQVTDLRTANAALVDDNQHMHGTLQKLYSLIDTLQQIIALTVGGGDADAVVEAK